MSTNTTTNTRKLTGNTLASSSHKQHLHTQPQSNHQHHQHQHNQHQHQHNSHAAKPALASRQPQQQQQQHQHPLSQHHQPLQAHTVPPRYQPPPHPPTSSSSTTAAAVAAATAAGGGILKNIPHGSRSVPPPPPPQPAGAHLPLNLKYPPDVPKLQTVYIPDGVHRNGVHTQQQQQQPPPPLPPPAKSPAAGAQRPQLHQQRSHSGVGPVGGATAHHVPGLLQRHPTAIGADELRASLQHHQAQVIHHHQLLGQHHSLQQQQQHQQHQHQQHQHHDMLKFVRKPDADSGSASSASSASNGAAAAPQQSSGGGGSTVNGGGGGGGVVATNGVGAHHNGTGGGGGSGSANSARITAEQNRQLQQSMLAELRSLKEANQRLSDDNQELRDLCCFLDDDRQKGRKLAREWQRFGRYTASVMRQEVSAYQSKLRQLDDKQQELIRDNLELKELCLYMDEERTNVAATLAVAASACGACGTPVAVRPSLRDDGDGSSSSTNADEPMPAMSSRQFERQIPELNIRPTLSDQTLQYVRALERKVRQLEVQAVDGSSNGSDGSVANGRPEAVVRALQILEVREQIERDRTVGAGVGAAGSGGGCTSGSNAAGLMNGTANGNGSMMAGDLGGTLDDSVVGGLSAGTELMDDGEKALVREMCNVVWRKLEDSPGGGSGLE